MKAPILSAERRRARDLYERGDRASFGSAERADFYRDAAAAQRQAEAVEELERVTKARRRRAA